MTLDDQQTRIRRMVATGSGLSTDNVIVGMTSTPVADTATPYASVTMTADNGLTSQFEIRQYDAALSTDVEYYQNRRSHYQIMWQGPGSPERARRFLVWWGTQEAKDAEITNGIRMHVPTQLTVLPVQVARGWKQSALIDVTVDYVASPLGMTDTGWIERASVQIIEDNLTQTVDVDGTTD